MYFTEFIVTEKTGNSVDPLGFLRPSSAIVDGIFKQFTVLSNHPSYHGFLCFALLFLCEKGMIPGKPGFNREFRCLESLWGLLNFQAGDSILNVTKYERVFSNKCLKLSEIKKNHKLFDRLNYGTLGHYSSPSIFWGLLDRKRGHLTELGQRLGRAWSERGNMKFSSLMEQWVADKESVCTLEHRKAGELFRLTATPAEAERQVWRDIIKCNCARNPVIEPLWANPLPLSIRNLAQQEKTYTGYFQGVLEHFKKTPELCRCIDLCRRFEMLAGLVQFVFEWEYVQRLDQVKKIGLSSSVLQDRVARQITTQARELVNEHGAKDLWKLFVTLSGLTSYADQSCAILEHHVVHQGSKDAAPFINGDIVAVRDKADPKIIANIFSSLQRDSTNLNNTIAWSYKRNWHFERGALWLEYAGGRI